MLNIEQIKLYKTTEYIHAHKNNLWKAFKVFLFCMTEKIQAQIQ